MARVNSQALIELRKKQADVLTEARSQRTDEEQLELLDIRFGKGKGAVKERTRLAKRINEAAEQKKKDAPKKEAAKAVTEAASQLEGKKIPSGHRTPLSRKVKKIQKDTE